MPTTRRRRSRHLEPGLTDYQRAWFLDEDPSKENSDDTWWRIVTRHHKGGPEYEGELWNKYRDELLAGFVAEHPGRRPDAWWTYDAPREPAGRWPGCFFDGSLPLLRRRLSGIGTPDYEVEARVPALHLGMPTGFVDADPANPPQYETQAGYLQRHGLFLPGEAKRLKPADFEPERVLPEIDDAPASGAGGVH